jgi:hypothetical protein
MSRIELVLLQTTPLCYDVIKTIMSYAYSDNERWTRNNFKAVMDELTYIMCRHEPFKTMNRYKTKNRFMLNAWNGYSMTMKRILEDGQLKKQKN